MYENTHSRPVSTLTLCLFAVLAGAVSGLGAVFFRGLIAIFHNLLFLRKLSVHYDATVHTPHSPWGPFIIVVPVAGAIVVAFLVGKFAPEAKGHGVPEVIDAIHYHGGRMRPIVAVIKSLASAISIGSGGSVGREGPIVQIGSSFSSTLGELLRLPAWQRITLIAGGAGGGIAATFNTPVGGVLFAVEIILQEVSSRTLVPVTIATVTATYIGQIAFGPRPAFVIPAFESPYFHLLNPWVLICYAGLGILTGLVSALFIKGLYGCESFFEKRIGGSYYRQHMLGMLLVGLMMYGSLRAFGHYYIEGVGYSTIQDILSGVHIGAWLLILLFAMKLLATCLTLGSGASGGVFSPALFMGATVGEAYGQFLSAVIPRLTVSPAAFAVVGMAGVVGGSTAAAITAIVMIFEMTLDYRVVVPMTLTVAVSYGIRRALIRDSIYTRKLALRGHRAPEALQSNVYFDRVAKSLMDTNIELIPASEKPPRHGSDRSDGSDQWLLAVDGGKVVGLLRGEYNDAAKNRPDATAGELARKDFCIVTDQTPLSRVMAVMLRQNASFALIVPDELSTASQIEGLITRTRLADAVVEAVDAFE